MFIPRMYSFWTGETAQKIEVLHVFKLTYAEHLHLLWYCVSAAQLSIACM
jgi:hypothetical protein